MTSDLEETNGLSRHVVLLDGHDNYKEWLRYLRNLLIRKDLFDVAKGSEERPMDNDLLKAWKRSDLKAFSTIDATLSQNVHDNLPIHLTDYSDPSTTTTPAPAVSYLLLTHLTVTYSAVQGARKAELLSTIWHTKLAEGDDPSPHLAKLKAAFTSIVTAGSRMSDEELTYAILMSLPPSYNTLVQSFYLSPTKDSSSAINAIRTEWRRQEQPESSAVLLAKAQAQLAAALAAQANRGGENQGKKKPGKPESMWCDHHQSGGHNTKNCLNPQVANNRSHRSSNVATATSAPPGPSAPNSPSANISTAAYVRPSMFLAHTDIQPAVLLSHSTDGDVVVDSGATHHMVHDKRLLVNLSPLLRPATITVGNGATIMATESGSLHLRNTTLENVLHVPALGRNLLSVAQATRDQSWAFHNNKASLIQADKAIITASLKNGLYILDPSSMSPTSALLVSAPDSTLLDWHRRLGHLDVRAVVQMGKEGRLDNKVDWGLVRKGVYGFQCPLCIQGKGKRLPSPISASERHRPLYSIHVDLWGPARTPSTGRETLLPDML